MSYKIEDTFCSCWISDFEIYKRLEYAKAIYNLSAEQLRDRMNKDFDFAVEVRANFCFWTKEYQGIWG